MHWLMSLFVDIVACFVVGGKQDGVAKSPPYCVTLVFQDIDLPDLGLAPEKPPNLAGRNFCLAISLLRVRQVCAADFAPAIIFSWYFSRMLFIILRLPRTP
ncbi:MAG: hypothetical protein K0A93_06460 [Desulfuromonadaceae bacterium]|nr:hypothetical protein [Desulfuromonadaceae bacterium]